MDRGSSAAFCLSRGHSVVFPVVFLLLTVSKHCFQGAFHPRASGARFWSRHQCCVLGQAFEPSTRFHSVLTAGRRQRVFCASPLRHDELKFLDDHHSPRVTAPGDRLRLEPRLQSGCQWWRLPELATARLVATARPRWQRFHDSHAWLDACDVGCRGCRRRSILNGYRQRCTIREPRLCWPFYSRLRV